MMTKEEKIQQFDPNGLGIDNGNLFGLPFELQDAEIAIIPVPWEATVSYRTGTAKGPEAVLNASLQVDLFDSEMPDAWKMGIYMLPIEAQIAADSDTYRELVAQVLDELEEKGTLSSHFEPIISQINEGGENLKNWVKAQALELMSQGKKVALLGGDHSTPLGLMEAFAEKNDNYGILHIDAHCDLREAYEGFTYSHASIMYNALKYPQVSSLIQVGIRDFCEAEYQLAQDSKGRVIIHDFRSLEKARFKGESWDKITDRIVADLPLKVYVSFDIDGLDPSLCPNTGTPVPGGFMFEEAMYLIEKVVSSGRVIIGFDLNEVAPSEHDEWDANVGARVLYKLCNFTGKSNGLIG